MQNDRYELEIKAQQLNLSNIKKHIFLCCAQNKSKCCNQEESLAAWKYLKHRLKELNLTETVHRTKADCLRVCMNGPIAVVYPDGVWYHSCTSEVLERIIQEHLINGMPVEEYVFAKNKRLEEILNGK